MWILRDGNRSGILGFYAWILDFKVNYFSDTISYFTPPLTILTYLPYTILLYQCSSKPILLELDLIKYNWVGKFCHALEMIRKMGPLFRPYTCVCGNGSIHIEIKTEIIRIQFKLIASQFLVISIQRITAVTFCGRLFFRTSFSFSTSLYVFLFSSDLATLPRSHLLLRLVKVAIFLQESCTF